MKRVAALWLPNWSIDRIVRAEPMLAPSAEPGAAADPTPLMAAAAAERALQCDAPHNSGWRPGARWARRDVEMQIAALPQHQRPPRRIPGRASEAADPPFRRLSGNDGGTPPRPHRPMKTRPAVPGSPPLVTVHKTGSRIEIAAVAPAAAALGIAPGMALTQARASVPGIVVRDADPDGDADALMRLATMLARRWSPIVARSDPDGLFIDLTGTAHLHGGEARFAERLTRLLKRFGIMARIAVADTAGAAWALARHVAQPVALCPPGGHAAALAPLPVTALRLAEKNVALLRRLGVKTVGDVAALDRAPFVRRFGAGAALRLDQAMGHAPEPLDPVPVVEPIAVTQRFTEPIATPEAIAHWLAALVVRLVAALAGAGQGARALLLVADRVDHEAQVIRVGFARPNRDGAHILRLIVRRIEEIAPGYGIDALHLHVRRAEPLAAEPFDERLGERAADLASLIDTLTNRGVRVWRDAPIGSDVPERCVRAISPLDPPLRKTAAMKRDDVRRLDRRAPDHPWHPRWPRPVRLLRRPERLDHVVAALPDQPPRRFRWRGRLHIVMRADGPERIVGEWWKHASERGAIRDYFRVEDEQGARFWLFRRGDGERADSGDLSWYMHGAFG
ncbi:Y-family DNA polymerase [Stakelama saccharophila]|uniref:DNA-directed DNA polymerase n=1 Tax=Stakelama saccharophila TaxID=3075605 RepID=A0ABZ0B4X0_9SPHN|nr:DNA polymerase Y family protein [Stakelama sp. W311]WNO52432.1 DNA polymerase Y family protein [Stakelama sp. W311]